MTGPYTGTVPLVVAGDATSLIPATTALANAVNAFGSWTTSWVPAWTAVTTNPTYVNATVVTGWTQIEKTVFFRLQITMGTSTTYGSGAYSFSLPVAATSAAEQEVTAVATSAAGLVYRGVGRISGSLIVRSLFVDGATGPSGLTQAVPFTWASGAVLNYSGSYEAA